MHFGLIKFHIQQEVVPINANRYWWKILVPTFEFGTMHAILLQLALIPLTMCHLTISNLQKYRLIKHFIPFQSVLRYHISLGYVIVFLVFLTTVVFLSFFGVLCSDGDEEFCNKLTSEIMITGYVIFAGFMTVGVTSYLRNVIPYRVFYAIHHLIFVVYILVIAHTFDAVARRDGGRSQTFKWFSASILYYVSDRAAMYMGHRYKTYIESSSIAHGNDGTRKLILLRLKKPTLFHFQPGQYIKLRIQSIDNTWHPFSIASGPESNILVFYIEVSGKNSWTSKLWNLTKRTCVENIVGSNKNDSERDNPTTCVKQSVEIMGPYRTAFDNESKHSEALIIGGGTGKDHFLMLLLFTIFHFSDAGKINILPVECPMF